MIRSVVNMVQMTPPRVMAQWLLGCSQVVRYVLGPRFKSKYGFTLDCWYQLPNNSLNSLVAWGLSYGSNLTCGKGCGFLPPRTLLSGFEQVGCFHCHTQAGKPLLVAPSYPYAHKKNMVKITCLHSILLLSMPFVCSLMFFYLFTFLE